jgi:hypothetical protein
MKFFTRRPSTLKPPRAGPATGSYIALSIVSLVGKINQVFAAEDSVQQVVLILVLTREDAASRGKIVSLSAV